MSKDTEAELDAAMEEEAPEKPKVKPSRKKATKKKAKRRTGPKGRGPGAPTSSQKRKRASVRAKAEERASQLAYTPSVSDEIDEYEGVNPRLDPDPENADAPQARRREMIWRRREAEGFGNGRRPIYDADGNDTGATTSSLD